MCIRDSSKPTTTVNVTYRVGSRHENYGETGMAHLLEHLVSVSYTHLRAHETVLDLVCRLLLEKKNKHILYLIT